MFAYCLNNPIFYLDSAGNYTAIANRNFCNYEPLPESCGGGGISIGISLGFLDWLCELIADGKRVIAKEGSAAKSVSKSPELKQTYTVYFLSANDDPSGRIIYVGRVKTKNLDKRMSYHNSRQRGLVGCISGLDYKCCRAIEQAGMVYWHSINTLDPLFNQIRGISPRNKNLYNYMAAIADLVFTDQYPDNSLLPVSYFYNWCEEEFLALTDY